MLIAGLSLSEQAHKRDGFSAVFWPGWEWWLGRRELDPKASRIGGKKPVRDGRRESISRISTEFQVFSEFFFLNWRIIALQCSVGFCCPTMWISHVYTYIPFLWASLPAWSQPRGHHGALRCALWARQQLPTCCVVYTWQSVNVKLMSRFISASPSHCVSTHPFSTFASLLLPWK